MGSLLAHTWDIQPDVLPHLVANNCVTLLNTLQSMKRYKLFENQAASKVVFISAAAAVRVKQELGLDSAQKGAGHNLIRNIALDLTPENIFVTEIMPGSTDTGFFDNDYTLETAVRITKNLGYHPTKETYPVFTAEQIGDAAKYVLDAKCNVRELVLLPYGQFPHLGA
ncbi:MAG: SDR family NAD(P)-dependent oxidoreductase [Candidatus Saccharimonadales bacterium]